MMKANHEGMEEPSWSELERASMGVRMEYDH